jgi:uncharacterized membrane protein
MVKVANSVVIDRPIHEVFEFVANFENEPRWKPDVVRRVERLSGSPMEVGARYREVSGPPGAERETTFEVTECKLGEGVAFRSSGGSRGAYSFEETDGGTRVTFAVDVRARTLVTLLATPRKFSRLRRGIGNELIGLRRVLEHRSDAT